MVEPGKSKPVPETPFERILSFPLVVAAMFSWLFYSMVPHTISDPDIWWHLRNAEYQLQFHRFITQDMYSFTALGAPWMNHEWLAEIPFYLGWHAMGAPGVFLVMVCAIEVILLGVFYLAFRHSGSIYATGLVSVAVVLFASISFGPRTLLFGWICLVAQLCLLDHFRAHAWTAWALPPLYLAWVNTHGSWIIGLVVLGAYIACGSFRVSAGAIENGAWTATQLRSLIVATALSVGALFINPYGWRLVAYPFNLAFHQKLNIANVEEWRTLDFHSPRGRILLGALALMFLMQLLKRRTWQLYELAFLAIGVYSAFTYTRFLFLAGILVMPILAKDLAVLGGVSAEKKRPWLNVGLILAVVVGLAIQIPKDMKKLDAGSLKFPEKALPALQSFHPQGNVFHEYNWGGFMIWNLRQIPVMVDSRVDIFEYNGSFKDYLDAIRLNGTLGILDKYKIRYVLFEKDTPLSYFLLHTSGWKVDYDDGETMMFERAAGGAQTVSAH